MKKCVHCGRKLTKYPYEEDEWGNLICENCFYGFPESTNDEKKKEIIAKHKEANKKD